MFASRKLLQPIDIEELTGVKTTTSVQVLRLDLPDPVSGGNKPYKLKYPLLQALQSGYGTLLTFGGPFSNHIAATARTAAQNGLRSIGIIRGEPVSNVTLNRAARDGMQLVFTDRQTYRRRKDPEYLQELSDRFNKPYILPEGGSSPEGVQGCMEILEGTGSEFNCLTVACGTGATLAGLAMSKPQLRCIGFSVLRDQGAIAGQVSQWTNSHKAANWEITDAFAFGGYARSDLHLEAFIQKFTACTGIPAEPVYTGKMFFGMVEWIRQGVIPEGSKVIAIHTGGMQYLMES